jgi:hypothetical protein
MKITEYMHDITWITQRIKTSCKRKRELYLIKNNMNKYIKLHYDKYCKILNKEITSAKNMAYDNYCIKMRYKMKSTWNIINIEKGRTMT